MRNIKILKRCQAPHSSNAIKIKIQQSKNIYLGNIIIFNVMKQSILRKRMHEGGC